MGILHLLKPKRKKQFVFELDFTTNRGRQSHLAIETLVRLRESNIEEDDELKVNYVFHADTAEKAIRLADELQNLNYLVQQEVATGNKKLFVIKGQTTPMRMMHEVLRKWAVDMCDLGYKHDCDFESWDIIDFVKEKPVYEKTLVFE
jgi:hypothetical protein